MTLPPKLVSGPFQQKYRNNQLGTKQGGSLTMQVKLGPKANADVNRFLKSQNDVSSAGENWEASAAPAMTEQNEIFIEKLPIREN